ncbi:uncharacterized protein [Dermacentor andersoni]|uniref:uncharacterized protein n=1 Tax=Dermacentor andersoni TaxID=34620 RepID=UPI0024177FF1|nr:uncharacterized protein LOC129387477 [Dermacentor andersoni]
MAELEEIISPISRAYALVIVKPILKVFTAKISGQTRITLVATALLFELDDMLLHRRFSPLAFALLTEHVSTPDSSTSVTSSTPASPTAEQPNAILLQPKIATASSVSGALSDGDVNATTPANRLSFPVTYSWKAQSLSSTIPASQAMPRNLDLTSPGATTQDLSTTSPALEAVTNHAAAGTSVAPQSVSTVQPLSSSRLPRENGNFKSRAFDVISSGLADIARKIPSTDTLPIPRAASHVPGSASSFPKKEGVNVANPISTRLETATHSHESQRDPPRHVISFEERPDDDAKSAGPAKAPATRCYCETIREDLSSDAASSLAESTPLEDVAESMKPEVNGPTTASQNAASSLAESTPLEDVAESMKPEVNGPTTASQNAASSLAESTPLEDVAESIKPEVNGPTTASENAASSLSKLTPLEHVADSGGPEARESTPASDDTAKVTWSAIVTKQDTFEMTSLLSETSASNKTYAPPYDFDATRKKPHSGDQVMCNSSFCLHEATRLSAIFHRNLDPCDDFYAFACQDWLVTSSDQEKYEHVNDALSGTVEELAKGILEAGPSSTMAPLLRLYEACMQDASASGADLRETLASFGLDITKVDAPSPEDVLVAAANVLLGLGIAPLLSIVLQPNPEVKGATILAVKTIIDLHKIGVPDM